MTWEQRIIQAAYTSPNGNRATFLYEDVSRVSEKKTAAFDFPDADGTLIQDLGQRGRRYPLRLFFSGDNHDTEADAFEALLLERGVGVLEHPRYGQVDVVPFGEITQRDDLKTRAAQTVIEVTFWETIGTAYPTSQTSTASEATQALSDYVTAAAEELNDALALDTQLEKTTLTDQWENFVNSVDAALTPIAAAQDDAARQFQDIKDSIDRGLSVLVNDPLTLGFQTLALIRAPAQTAALIGARLDAYGSLAQSMITGSTDRIGQGSTLPAVISPTNDNRAINELTSRKLFAQGAVSGSALAALNGPYDTQPQALDAAERLLEQLEDVTTWLDDTYRALDGKDTGGAYQQLQQAVAITAGALVALAFDLKRERRITLTRPRSLFDFVGEYYGSPDEYLDTFINTNSLTGSEILELPKGRTVVVYE